MQALCFSWRNVWRNKRRTLLTAGAVAFACTILSFIVSLQQSSYRTAIEASTAIFQGHLQVQPRGYQDDPRLYTTLKQPTALQARVDSLPTIQASAQRINAFALVSSEERTYGVQVVGVQPGKEPLISTIPGTVRSGRYLMSQDTYHGVLGEALARNLQITPGDELTLLGQGADGSMAAAVLSVTGIFSSGSNEMDRSLIQIPLTTAQDVFSLPEQSNVLVLRTSDLTDSSIAGKIERSLSDELEVLDWERLNPGLKEAIELDMVSGWLFLFSLVLIVAFGVLNTFLMSLLERMREFGLLMSLGMSTTNLMKMVALELVLLLIVGTAPGVVLGSLIIVYFSVQGFSVPGAEEVNKLWNLPAAIYPELVPLYLLAGPAVVLIVSLILVLPFTLRLRRLNPVEALSSV